MYVAVPVFGVDFKVFTLSFTKETRKKKEER